MYDYIKIERMREKDEQITEEITMLKNTQGFEVGDLISITEKIDGANSSITWEDNRVKSFSSKNELTKEKGLNGFFDYALSLEPNIFEENPNYVVYGEWLVYHTVKYEQDYYNKWYVFSIYDKENDIWLDAYKVKDFCYKYDLEYVHELYFGPFISWEHCKSFCNSPKYGTQQEGIIVRNITKINNTETECPFILKIVNESFKETKRNNHIRKITDKNRLNEKAESLDIMRDIVTEARVRKHLNKLVDEEIIPKEIEPKHLGIIAQVLPSRIFEDCVLEENQTVIAAGRYASKSCKILTMDCIKKLLVL